MEDIIFFDICELYIDYIYCSENQKEAILKKIKTKYSILQSITKDENLLKIKILWEE